MYCIVLQPISNEYQKKSFKCNINFDRSLESLAFLFSCYCFRTFSMRKSGADHENGEKSFILTLLLQLATTPLEDSWGTLVGRG